MFGHDSHLTVCLHVDIDGSWTIDTLAELISDNTILHGTLLACHVFTCTATLGGSISTVLIPRAGIPALGISKCQLFCCESEAYLKHI